MANPKLGITLIKKFTYRGDPNEEWASTYHFQAPPPTTAALWDQVFQDLIDKEKLCYPATSKVVRAYAYDSDDPKAPTVHVKDYELEGAAIPGELLVPANSYKFAGDQAAMIWAQLDKRNTRGKFIYLRKYFHDGFGDLTTHDNLATNYQVALTTFCNELAGGQIASLGVWQPLKYSIDLITNDCSKYVTTRTLKRRGKRPPTPA